MNHFASNPSPATPETPQPIDPEKIRRDLEEIFKKAPPPGPSPAAPASGSGKPTLH